MFFLDLFKLNLSYNVLAVSDVRLLIQTLSFNQRRHESVKIITENQCEC